MGLRCTRSVPGVLGGAVAMPQEVAKSSSWGLLGWFQGTSSQVVHNCQIRLSGSC